MERREEGEKKEVRKKEKDRKKDSCLPICLSAYRTVAYLAYLPINLSTYRAVAIVKRSEGPREGVKNRIRRRKKKGEGK